MEGGANERIFILLKFWLDLADNEHNKNTYHQSLEITRLFKIECIYHNNDNKQKQQQQQQQQQQRQVV